MPNATKVEKVRALRERIQGSNALLLAEYRGLSVKDATELRRTLSETARFAVVKNTLMQRAAGEAGIQELEELLAGPTAVAFVEGDVVAAAKKVVDAAAKFPALVLKGAYLEGRVLGAAEARALATLESREVMLSRIAGMLKSEMSRAVSMFQALQSRFVGVLEAYRDKLPAGLEDLARIAEAATAGEPEAVGEPAVAEPAAATEEEQPAAAADPVGRVEAADAEEPAAAEEPATADEPEAAEAQAPLEAPDGEETSGVEASATDEEE